jgi:hypothetical protein
MVRSLHESGLEKLLMWADLDHSKGSCQLPSAMVQSLQEWAEDFRKELDLNCRWQTSVRVGLHPDFLVVQQRCQASAKADLNPQLQHLVDLWVTESDLNCCADTSVRAGLHSDFRWLAERRY